MSRDPRLAISYLVVSPLSDLTPFHIIQDVHEHLMFAPHQGAPGRWRGCSTRADEIMWLRNYHTTYFEVAFSPRYGNFKVEFRVEPASASGDRVEGGRVQKENPPYGAFELYVNAANGWSIMHVTFDASHEWVEKIPFSQRSMLRIVIRAWEEGSNATPVEVPSATIYCQRGMAPLVDRSSRR